MYTFGKGVSTSCSSFIHQILTKALLCARCSSGYGNIAVSKTNKDLTFIEFTFWWGRQRSISNGKKCYEINRMMCSRAMKSWVETPPRLYSTWGLNDQDKLDVGRTFWVEEVAGGKALRCECQEQGSTHKVLCMVFCTW